MQAGQGPRKIGIALHAGDFHRGIQSVRLGDAIIHQIGIVGHGDAMKGQLIPAPQIKTARRGQITARIARQGLVGGHGAVHNDRAAREGLSVAHIQRSPPARGDIGRQRQIAVRGKRYEIGQQNARTQGGGRADFWGQKACRAVQRGVRHAHHGQIHHGQAHKAQAGI